MVPAINSYASIVLKYKEALDKYFPGESPDYVSFEGYIDGSILAEAVKRVGRDINTEKLVDELEQIRAVKAPKSPVCFIRHRQKIKMQKNQW